MRQVRLRNLANCSPQMLAFPENRMHLPRFEPFHLRIQPSSFAGFQLQSCQKLSHLQRIQLVCSIPKLLLWGYLRISKSQKKDSCIFFRQCSPVLQVLLPIFQQDSTKRYGRHIRTSLDKYSLEQQQVSTDLGASSPLNVVQIFLETWPKRQAQPSRPNKQVLSSSYKIFNYKPIKSIRLHTIQKYKYIATCMSNNMQQRSMEKHQPFKCQLQRLFVYYSSFGDKDNPSLLKIQNYRRLLTDMQLIPPPPNNNNQASLANQCDVIFYSKASPATSLTFNTFLDLLQPLALLFFAENSFDQLLKFHMQPLHDHIMKQTQFGESITLISPQLLKESSYKFLQRFQETFSLIYGHYFTKSGKGGEQEELKTFTKLSRQLGFTSKIVSKPVAYLIFLFLRNRDSVIAFRANTQLKRSKFRFDFNCFLDYLIFLSQLGRRGPETDQTKLYFLLQSIQISQGYQTISKIVKLQHFFVTNDMLEEEVKAKKVFVENQKADQRMFQVVEAPLRKKLGEYYEPLKTKFVKLCVKKHVQSNFYLNQGVVMKMLARICPKLSQNTCEILIASVGKLSFENFVTLINLTAEKLKIDRQKLYDEVARYTEGSSSIALVIENMQLEQEEQESCIQILRLSRSYLRTLFDFYEFKGTLSLPNYIKFNQETEIIPKVLKVIQASDIFAACEKGSSLTFQQFQQSFLRLIISVHFPFELQGVQRLLYILQTICKSKRGETLMKKNLLLMKQHPLYKIRIIFEETYRRMHSKVQSH